MNNQRGSISKRNGSWGFSFSFHDESGVQRKIRKSDRSWKQKDAQKALSETIAHADAGHAFGTAKTTVAEYLLSWLEQYERSGHVKQTTTETTRAHINAYLIPYIGSLALKDLRPMRIKRLYSDLLVSGGTGAGKSSAGKPLSPKTVRNIAGTFHKALGDAVRLGIIATNPTTNLDLPKWDRPEMKIWDETDIGNFLTFSFANDDPMFPIWMLLFSTGLRCGEVCGIRWDDVDFVESAISIKETRVIAGKHGVITTSPKSRAGSRRLQIDSNTLDALARHKDAQEASASVLGASCFPLVATDADGEPIHPRALARRFQASSRRCGLPEIRLHDIRHTHASLLIASGESLPLISHRLGHGRISTTLDTYAHRMPTADREASNRFGLTIENAMKNASKKK
jgi:integrase